MTGRCTMLLSTIRGVMLKYPASLHKLRFSGDPQFFPPHRESLNTIFSCQRPPIISSIRRSLSPIALSKTHPHSPCQAVSVSASLAHHCNVFGNPLTLLFFSFCPLLLAAPKLLIGNYFIWTSRHLCVSLPRLLTTPFNELFFRPDLLSDYSSPFDFGSRLPRLRFALFLLHPCRQHHTFICRPSRH